MRLPTAWSQKPALRRRLAAGLSVASMAMLVAAVWFFAYPFYTDVRAGTRQEALRVELASSRIESDFRTGTIEEGKPLTRIVIPRLGLDAVVVEGTSTQALAAGMGHYIQTPLPGEPGNVGIAGHRTMNGRAFGDLDKLRPGDRIELITPLARHAYEVMPPFDSHSNPWVTEAHDWSVVAETAVPMLTLTTCHPRGSSKQRLVARAFLVSTEATS